jgi:hypothetical protein
MINKYIELHEKFIELLAEYHNNHIYFIRKPNTYTLRLVAKTMRELKRLTREMKVNNVELSRTLLEEKRKSVIENKIQKEMRKNERLKRINSQYDGTDGNNT